MYPAYESLASELDKTAVISEDFKKFIRAWVFQIMKEAYDKGVNDERTSNQKSCSCNSCSCS